MKVNEKVVLKTADYLKVAATVITSLGVVLGLMLYVAKPHIQKFIAESVPMSTLTSLEKTIALEKKLDETLALQEKLRVQNQAIKETLIKQDANIRVLIFITRGKDGFDTPSGVNIPE